jgi:hypothetical protein
MARRSDERTDLIDRLAEVIDELKAINETLQQRLPEVPGDRDHA